MFSGVYCGNNNDLFLNNIGPDKALLKISSNIWLFSTIYFIK